MNSAFENLVYLYPDEIEVKAWFQSLSEFEQEQLHYEFQHLVPDWYDFLRQKRYDLDKN